MKNLRKSVFGTSIFIMILTVLISLIFPEIFQEAVEKINNFIGEKFGFFFNIVALFLVIACVYLYFSPLGKKVIGGEGAKPLLSKWSWFTITLCTTIAAGILFWSTAEPIYHLVSPPKFLNIGSNSYAASIFSMSTMFLHWGITPYAIYCAPAAIFAFVHYNMKRSCSFNSCLIPLFGDRIIVKISSFIDILCLFITGIGLSASLGVGILSVSGGVTQIFHLKNDNRIWIIIGFIIVLCFIISSASGLMNGIKFLSNYNTKIFIVILIFVFLFGPTSFICGISTESFGSYIGNFFEKSLTLGIVSDDNWSRLWTIQYLASWLSWAPMTAIFLGRISYGYTYKDFILINLVLPACFSILWVSILGGNSIYIHLNTIDLMNFIEKYGTESVLYKVFEYLPLAKIMMPVLVGTIFLSFVTAADSTTNAMASLCVNSNEDGKFESPAYIKIIWGILMGTIAILMIMNRGVMGIKMLSTIGGFPATFILFIAGISLIKVAKSPDKYI